jgi:hypothetical protein
MTGAVFLYVAKAFDTVLITGLFYRLTIPHFQSYLVKTVSYTADCLKRLQIIASARRSMRAGVAQGGFFIFNVYVNDMSTPSRQVESAMYADDTALTVTTRSPFLLVR